MSKRLVVYPLALVLLVCVAIPVHAELTREDQILLGLMFRNRFVPFSQEEDASPLVKEIAEKAGQFGRGFSGDPVDQYKTLIQGLAILYLGDWNEGTELATVFDMRLAAKLYQPGDTIAVTVIPVYERDWHFSQHYLVHLKLVDPQGNTVGDEQVKHFHELASAEVSLSIPADAESGRYEVAYALTTHRDDKAVIMSGSRSAYVLQDLRKRLASLEADLKTIESKGLGKGDLAKGLAATTAQWHHDIYAKGLEEDVPGAYTGHPIFMTSAVAEAGMVIDRLDFTNELALAEELAQALIQGEAPLAKRRGDMRLAYRSPADGELVPFRIYVPSGFDRSKQYPLVMGLHGAGGDENSFMDRYQGLYKKNAERRGYIAVSANGRGPYGGYRGNSGKDVIDVLDLVQKVYPIDASRTYLIGHSMGGGGTVALGFDNAARFAALAPIAGFGGASQLEKAKDMPLFIGQGDQDALVPVERARQFHQAAKDLGMPHVKYVERKGTDHLAIVEQVMDQAFDWFDSHKKM